MGTLLGNLKLESRENYEQFLEELGIQDDQPIFNQTFNSLIYFLSNCFFQGVSPENIKIANSFKPSMTNEKNGDTYTTIFRGGPKGEEIMKFKHLEEFNHKCEFCFFVKFLQYDYFNLVLLLAWTGELVKVKF